MNDAESASVLRNRIGFWALVLFGVGDMLGAGIYGLIGKVAGHMGNAVWLAFVGSMFAALFTGLTYASLGSKYPRAAGAAFVSQRAFGLPLLSYVVGLATMASGITSIATATRVFASQLHAMATSVPFEVLVVGFVMVIALVNLRGISFSSKFNSVCTLIELSGLIVVIFAGVSRWGTVNYLETPNMTEQALSIALVLQGSVITFYSFVGFEDLLNISEEVENPAKIFPIALITALGITTLIYICVAISAVSVVPFNQLFSSKQPLVDVVKTAVPWFPSSVFAFIGLIAVANTALMNHIMGSRLMYGMAKLRLLPRFLSKIQEKTHTPHVAIAFITFFVCVLVIAGDISVLAKSTSVLLLSVFLTVNLSLFFLQKRRDEPTAFEIPRVVPLLGAIFCLAVLLNASMHEFLIAGSIVLVILVLFFVMKPSREEMKNITEL